MPLVRVAIIGEKGEKKKGGVIVPPPNQSSAKYRVFHSLERSNKQPCKYEPFNVCSAPSAILSRNICARCVHYICPMFNRLMRHTHLYSRIANVYVHLPRMKMRRFMFEPRAGVQCLLNAYFNYREEKKNFPSRLFRTCTLRAMRVYVYWKLFMNE